VADTCVEAEPKLPNKKAPKKQKKTSASRQQQRRPSPPDGMLLCFTQLTSGLMTSADESEQEDAVPDKTPQKPVSAKPGPKPRPAITSKTGYAEIAATSAHSDHVCL
jgi:hypothetical protein